MRVFRLQLFLLTILVSVASIASADQVAIPHTFSNGTVADADSVNANFQALIVESNDQDSRISALEATVAAHEGLEVPRAIEHEYGETQIDGKGARQSA